MNALREQSANLGNAITSVEQAVEMVSSVASTKAEEREVAEVARMGEDELSGNKICIQRHLKWRLFRSVGISFTHGSWSPWCRKKAKNAEKNRISCTGIRGIGTRTLTFAAFDRGQRPTRL